MAIIKSQIKRNRQNERRRLRNKSTRSEMHTRIKSALAHAAHAANENNVDSSDAYNSDATSATSATASDESKKALTEAIKCIDKAAAQKVIHKNTAARKKSRLYAQIRKN